MRGDDGGDTLQIGDGCGTELGCLEQAAVVRRCELEMVARLCELEAQQRRQS